MQRRARHSAQQWATWFDEFDSSNMTVSDFCRLKGVSDKSFYVWRRKLKEPNASDPSFVAVEVTGAKEVQIDLPGGAVLRVANQAESLRPVLEALAAIDGLR